MLDKRELELEMVKKILTREHRECEIGSLVRGEAEKKKHE